MSMRKDRIARKMTVLRMKRDSLLSDLDFFKEQDLDESDTRRLEVYKLQKQVDGINREILLLHFEWNR
jgi:hypothetical protein